MTNPVAIAKYQILTLPQGKVDFCAYNSPQAFFAAVQESGALGDLEKRVRDRNRDDGPEWIGLSSQTLTQVIKTGVCDKALASFNRASARIKTTHAFGGRLKPAVAGGTWIIPEFLAGNPLCARTKPREKLPHKAFRIAFRANSMVTGDSIASIMAPIAKALREYILSGGSAELTITYLSGYGEPNPSRGTTGAHTQIRVPLASDSAVALGCSLQMYRGFVIGWHGRVLSPIYGDALPPCRVMVPGCVYLTGNPSTDFPKLHALGIDCGVAP